MALNTFPLLDIEHLTENTFRLRVERPNIPIKSGQCFNIGIPGLGINREYSMYSSEDSPYLDFLIRSVEDGLISTSLQKCQPGDLIEIDGAYGEFCLERPLNNSNKYLFIATGTGIAPFHSFIETWPDLNYKLLHGVRAKNECYHFQDYCQDSYIPFISQPSNGEKKRRVTDFLSEESILTDTRIYICGNRNMIIDAFELLHLQGVYGDQIKTEVFF
jgi:ferredoxin/flavodoxin---NADP+ reductase